MRFVHNDRVSTIENRAETGQITSGRRIDVTDSTAMVGDGGNTAAPPSPFIRYRHSLDTYQQALAAGLDDAAYVSMVAELDRALLTVSGTGFVITPLVELRGIVGDESVWAKVETENVGGSHKARHLFGLFVQVLIDERAQSDSSQRPLAIASCGNAALGAAVIAAAVERELLVFVPVDANPVVLDELHRLGATVQVCERQPGQLGDPCLSGLDEALAAGARPFTVQGPICPGVIDGGRTLGLELADQLHEVGVVPADLYIQVGGGALATAVVDGLLRSTRLSRLPRLHPVQPATAHPYVVAWERLRGTLSEAIDDEVRAALIATSDDAMTPWPGQPSSIASGILDDVTYDWKTVLRHQLRTGGWPVLASEADFVRAVELSERALAGTGLTPPDATGAAGLAGLLADRARPTQPPDGPAVVVLSGRRREGAT